MSKTITENYKGFEIEFFIWHIQKGYYKITISNYRYLNTKQEEYYLKILDTYTNKIKEARKEAYIFIDNLKVIDWASNGKYKWDLPNYEEAA